ncbi:MAG: hypothetical protein H0V81_01940, partial [Solirubrobacterales bacterium]|nr:hypothetical protein [Solirubrobacterales bacterium]
AAATQVIEEQDVRAVPIGRHPRFKPVAGQYDGAPVAGLPCGPTEAARFGVHLELFAAGRVIVVPAGIGVADGQQDGAFVRGGRCRHALSTTEPTGVVEVVHGTRATLGDLFALWGEPLTPRRIASFRGPVRAYVDGEVVEGDPAAIRLRHHTQIVLAIGPAVPVHSAFAFRAGL